MLSLKEAEKSIAPDILEGFEGREKEREDLVK